MDRYTHDYANQHNRKSPPSKITYFLVLAILIVMMVAIYVYHPFTKILHTTYEKLFGAPKEEAIVESNNHPPKVRFEFYTALANSKVTETEQPVAIASHEELEESLSQVIHPRGKEE